MILLDKLEKLQQLSQSIQQV